MWFLPDVCCLLFHKWFWPLVQDLIWESNGSSCLLFSRAQTCSSTETVEPLLKEIKLNL